MSEVERQLTNVQLFDMLTHFARPTERRYLSSIDVCVFDSRDDRLGARPPFCGRERAFYAGGMVLAAFIYYVLPLTCVMMVPTTIIIVNARRFYLLSCVCVCDARDT